jgi:hypothetical protein
VHPLEPGHVEAPLPKIPLWYHRLSPFYIARWLRDYFLGEDPTLGSALVPMCFLSMALYTRKPSTNFIFDEQEALLANPYVRAVDDPHAKIHWLDAFYRDFWGLTPERTIGSYRPIPDIIWRALWRVFPHESAFIHDWINVLFHGLNGALMVVLVMKLTRRRGTAWMAGSIFVAAAVITEAVSGVVGIADVLGGLGAILAMLALVNRMWIMPLAVFVASLIGLYSKETALVVVPLVPATALACSQMTHPRRPMRWLRAILALVAAGAAFVIYVELRRRMFPIHVPAELSEEANRDKPRLQRTFAAMLRWYAQPGLPHDPLNNPLIEATPKYRIAGALRVWWRGLGQVVLPKTLSGDYSAPQEPIPDRLVFPESVLGAACLFAPFVLAPVLGVAGWLRMRRARKNGGPNSAQHVAMTDMRPLFGVALLWVVVSFLPVSNIPVVLPTVRAERFWYFPIIGSSIAIAIVFTWLHDHAKRGGSAAEKWAVRVLFLAFFGFQCFAARKHGLDYNDDLVFWDATRRAVPRSAKAHLNYSVMLGARGDLPGRLESNKVAYQLATQWPMASIYLGDTLCRMHRAPESVEPYLRGFDLAPNDMNLLALGLQCLWDEKQLSMIDPDDTEGHKLVPTPGSDTAVAMSELAAKHTGSWLTFLVDDILRNGSQYNGVNPKYRPRGYNEGPKKDE